MTSRTTRVGSSTLTSEDNFGPLLLAMARAAPVAALAMAQEAQFQAVGVFDTDGDGTWEPNAPATVEWKDGEKVMLGRTGALSESIEVRDGPSPKEREVGWFDDPHPDSDLTMAQLALVHETDRPWLSKVHDNADRADKVLAAGAAAYRGALA